MKHSTMKALETEIQALLIEDNLADVELFRKTLAGIPSISGNLLHYESLTEGLKKAQETPNVIVFLDLGLPESIGLETLSRFLGAVKNCPVIVLTGLEDLSTGVEAIRMGAQDYLVKGNFDAALLERVMRYAIERQHHLEKLEEQYEKIQTSLQEKEVLLKELHHRVKNNLQVISSLLRLQADSCEDSRARELLKASEQRVKSMSIVHERMYKSMSLTSIDFAEYVEEMAGFQLRALTNHTHELKLELSQLSIPVDQAIPCGLILNELITNAVKHAYSEGQKGIITIELSASDGMARLSVSDDGVGLPVNFDPDSSTSLGFEIITALTSQVKGELQIEHRSQSGTKIAVSFPVNEKAHSSATVVNTSDADKQQAGTL